MCFMAYISCSMLGHKGGFEGAEPVDMVLRTMQAGEPDPAEFEQ